MCGFVGLLDPTGFDDVRSASHLVSAMRDQLVHRGPDDAGLWLDAAAGVALGFRRLSIVDLSAAGHQPMTSLDGRHVLTLNGEIYNAREMRAEIEAVSGQVDWRGHSDTEVFVEAVALWGLEPALQRANGMFALAVWDRGDRSLRLARDRIGKKPLYYGWAGGAFVFGSELKALWRHPGFDFRIDADALASFFQFGYVLGPQSIFSSMSKLPAGHVLHLDQDTAARRVTVAPASYWSLKTVAARGLDAQEAGRPGTVEELDALVRDAVALRMAADVPVGVFLSGGIDSSLVAALMTAQSPGPVHSFAIGFDAAEWDESHHALAVADHLGTCHQESRISSADVLDVVGDLATIYDEPFADDSMIPTTLLCRVARRGVTVALSGDGGDELFAGYDRYRDAAHWLARRRAVPGAIRLLAGEVAARAVRPLARTLGWRRTDRRLELLGKLLRDGRAEQFNAVIMSQTLDPGRLTGRTSPVRNLLTDPDYSLGRSTDIDRLTFMDTMSFLTDDILAKVDRASMAASLEVRCPLLDYRVIEMSWRFPTDAKTHGAVGKLPLRELLYRHVPQAIVDRPKMGFSAPVKIWLRGALRDWAESLLSRDALGRHGLLDVDACRGMWEDFAVRGRGWNPVIWSVLMFQAWHESMARAAATHRRPRPERLRDGGLLGRAGLSGEAMKRYGVPAAE